MPYKFNWLVDAHLTFTPFWGEQTAEDLVQFDIEILEALDRATVPLLHVIFNYTYVKSLPSIKEYLTLKAGKHPKAGWVILTGLSNPIFRFIIATIVKVFGLRMRIMDTNQEALDFICEMDSTLPALGHLDLDAIRDGLVKPEAPIKNVA